MRKYLFFFLLTSACLSSSLNHAQTITTYAGTGTSGFSGDGGPATAAMLSSVFGIAFDTAGNLFISDYGRVRRVDAVTHVITTVGGTGASGYSGGGPATSALMTPQKIVVDTLGNIILAEPYNDRIRKILSSGIMAIVAGTGAPGYTGDGGLATAAAIRDPFAVAIDKLGNIYFSNNFHYAIRKVNPAGIISRVAGTVGISGDTGDGGPALSATIEAVHGIAVDEAGSIYLAGGNKIRKISPTGIISTVAGTGTVGFSGDGGPATAAQLLGANAISLDAYGNLYVISNTRIRKINPAGIISTVFTIGGTDLVVRNNGDFFVADNTGYRVRVARMASYPPAFAGGTVQSLTICSSSGANPVNSVLSVIDSNIGETLSWSVVSVPTHGTLVAAFSDTSTSGIISPTGLTYTPALGYIGTDVFTVQVSDGTFTATTTINVTVEAAPSAGTISGASSVCVAGSTALTGSVSGGSWSTASATASVTSGGVVNGISAGTATISYAVTNSCGTAYATHIMTVNATPSAGTLSGPSNVCIGSFASLTASVAGGTWSVINGAASVSSSGIATGIAAGTDTVIYTVTNGCGIDTVHKTITVSTGPPTGTIIGLPEVCVGSTILLTNAVTGGTWSVTNANATITSGGLVAGVTAGIDTVVYTITAGCGAANTTKVITVNPLPYAGVISGPSIVCVSSTITLSSPIAGGVWSSGSSNATVSAGGVVSGVTTGTATISYSYTNMCGTDIATKIVTVNTIPLAGTLSGPSTVCIGSSLTLVPTVSGGTWLSSSPNATVSSGGVVSGASAGTSTITYIVTNTCGSAFTTHLVNIGVPPPAGTITGPSSVCVAGSITVTNAVAGGTWSVTNPTATISGSGLVSGITAGVDTIVYTITAACGSTFATKAITVNPLPVAGTISGVSSVCIGTSAGMSPTVPGGVWSATTGTVSITTGGTATGILAGADVISYTVTNACGTASATHSILVNTMPFAGTITGPTSVCAGATISLSATVAGGVWSSLGTSASISSGGIVSGIVAGVETISYTVTNACGTVFTTRTITVNVTPTVGTIVGTPTVCVGTPSGYINTVSGGTWSSSGGSLSISTSGIVTATAAGVANITYTVSNPCGSVFAIKTLTINPLPHPGFISGPDSVCLGMTIAVSNAVTGGTWSIAGTRASISSSGIVTGLSIGIDTIVYTVSNPCGTSHVKSLVTVLPISACTTTGTHKIVAVSPIAIQVYPNPNNGSFSINVTSAEQEDASIVITNVIGQEIRKLNITTNTTNEISLQQPAGVYLLAVSTAGSRQVLKIIVE